MSFQNMMSSSVVALKTSRMSIPVVHACDSCHANFEAVATAPVIRMMPVQSSQGVTRLLELLRYFSFMSEGYDRREMV